MKNFQAQWMLSKREPDQSLYTGSWNLVCRHGWFGLQVLALNLNLGNVLKKNWDFNSKKKPSRFLAFLEKIQRSGMAAHTFLPLPITQRWVKFALSEGGKCSPALKCLHCSLRSPEPWGQGSDASPLCITYACCYLEFVATGLRESTPGPLNFQPGHLTWLLF